MCENMSKIKYVLLDNTKFIDICFVRRIVLTNNFVKEYKYFNFLKFLTFFDEVTCVFILKQLFAPMKIGKYNSLDCVLAIIHRYSLRLPQTIVK